MTQTSPTRIIMIDDDREDAFLTRLALKKIEQKTDFTHIPRSEDFITTLNAAADQLADIFLVDLNMPRVNGFEVLQALHQAPTQADAYVVMLTTSEAEEDRKKALSLGANDFVSKPSTPKALQLFLAAALSHVSKR